MPNDESTPTLNSRRSRRIAERSFWQSVEIRAVGVVLIFMAAVTYIQGSHIRDEGNQRQKQIDALAQALVSEQQNTVNNGEKPVAPDPKKIIESPDVVTVKGEKGDKGDPGDTVTGPPGKNGKDGADGSDGKDGQNATSEPPVTVTGPPGAPGEPGAPGKDGKDGVDGKNGSPPTDITITIDGTTYVCTPTADGSTSFQCDAKETSETPSPGSSDEIGAQQ